MRSNSSACLSAFSSSFTSSPSRILACATHWSRLTRPGKNSMASLTWVSSLGVILASCRYVVMPNAFNFSSMNGPMPLMTCKSSFTTSAAFAENTRVTPLTPVKVFPSLPVHAIIVLPLASLISAEPLSAKSLALATSSVVAPFLTSLFNSEDDAFPKTLKSIDLARCLTR